MDHPPVVGVSQGLGRLEAPARDLRGRQRRAGPLGIGQDIRQAAALDELHGVVVDAPFAADGEDRDDIGVVQPGHGLALAAEPLHRVFVGHGAEPQDLERHASAERGLLGLIDHAHAAPAELAENAELAERGRRLRRCGAGGAVNELDAGQTRLELRGQLRMVFQQLVAIGCLARLELGQVTVQDADQFRGRVGRRDRLRLMRLVRIGLNDRLVDGLGHFR